MFKIKIFTFATCLTLSGVVLPALALELSTPFSSPKLSLDRSAANLNKTRQEFTQPDFRTPTPAISPSPSPVSSPTSTTSPFASPSISPSVSPAIIPIAPANPLPVGGAGVQGLGDQPIIPTINILPEANRREFQVPDLRLPNSPTPIPSP